MSVHTRQHVAAAAPPGHRERGDRLWHLGVTLRDLARHGDGDTAAGRRQARHVFAEAASAAGPPNVRIKSFQHLGAMEAALGDPHAALAAYEAAVAVGCAYFLAHQAMVTGELTGGGQGRAGWHAGAAFSIMLSGINVIIEGRAL